MASRAARIAGELACARLRAARATCGGGGGAGRPGGGGGASSTTTMPTSSTNTYAPATG